MKVRDSICGICKCSIKENTLFASLTDKELGAFKDVVKTITYAKRETVFMEGDECKGLYIVRTGRIKLLRASRDGREQIIKILAPGELLGLEVFHDAAAYSNNAVAMDDADLCFVSKHDFLKVLRKEPTVASKIVVALGRELHDAYERIGSLGLLNAKEKLAQLLCSLARDYGIEAGGKTRLQLTLSRLEIAELLGITQETSIRLLKSFKEDGILDIKRKEIIIEDMPKLASIGGGE